MIIYRKNPLPVIYSQIPFLRRVTREFADCKEDLGEINFLKEASEGVHCISELEKKNMFLIAIALDNELFNLRGAH